MPRKLRDLTGEVFGRLTARRRHGGGTPVYWECDCECGGTKNVRGSHLIAGGVSSCGCRTRERMAKLNLKHGMTHGDVYRIWSGILTRCENKNDPGFKRYGGRGITVCDEWRNDFTAFAADMGPRPSPDHSVERKNNDGPYSPENCVWATKDDQANNRRSNRVVTINGEQKTASRWARQADIRVNTFLQRLNNGVPEHLLLKKRNLTTGARVSGWKEWRSR